MATKRSLITVKRLISYRYFCTSGNTDLFYMSGYQALQKKRTRYKLSNIEWNPKEMVTLKENKWIMDAVKPHQVVNIVKEALNCELNPDTMMVIFNCAIRKCVELGGYPQCWQLFVTAKNTNHINTQIYTTMIWLNLNSWRRVHFDKALELYQEMKNNGFAISNHTCAALINGCARKHCYQQGIQVWNDLQNDSSLTPDAAVWNAIIDLYCYNTDMNNAGQCYQDMSNKAHIKPDNFTFKSLLNGYGATIARINKYEIKDVDINEYLTRAENVFYDAVMSWQENKDDSKYVINQRVNVIQAWMNVYATIGDIHTCLVIFKWLLNMNGIDFDYNDKIGKKRKKTKTKDMEQWLNDDENVLNSNCYPLKIQTFGIVLKACLNTPKLVGKEMNGLLISLMDVMENKCEIKRSTDIYGMMFQLYARLLDTLDIKDLDNLYQDMLEKCESKPTERELNEYARTYLAFMDHNGATQDQKQDFLAILMQQFRELDVTPSVYTKEIIQQHSN